MEFLYLELDRVLKVHAGVVEDPLDLQKPSSVAAVKHCAGVEHLSSVVF